MTQCLESIAHGSETSAGDSKWPTQGVCAACTSFSYVSTVESFEDAALVCCALANEPRFRGRHAA
jgi:hypothetical protein